jgi:hypothetical protein
VIDLATAGADWLSQSPSSLGFSVEGIDANTPLAAFVGTAAQRVPGVKQLDGFADIEHNRMFIGIPVSNWGPDHLNSWPRNLIVLHEALHFVWNGGAGDVHRDWAAILGAAPSSGTVGLGSSNILNDWLNSDCPPKAKN